jgi:hypothetical protein
MRRYREVVARANPIVSDIVRVKGTIGRLLASSAISSAEKAGLETSYRTLVLGLVDWAAQQAIEARNLSVFFKHPAPDFGRFSITVLTWRFPDLDGSELNVMLKRLENELGEMLASITKLNNAGLAYFDTAFKEIKKQTPED